MNAKKTALPTLIALLILGATSTARAETITGTIGVTLAITSACIVDNGAGAGTSWGTLDFGSYTNLATDIDAQVTSTVGNGLTITCSIGLPATVYIRQGANDSGSLRTLSPSAGTYSIPYRLYSDAGRTAEIPPDGASGIPLTSDGTPQSIPIHARILSSDQTIIAPTAGAYTDTVSATIEW